MANQDQLAILRRGVDEWNLWRRENRDIRIDLSHIDLNGIYLQGADLRDADLTFANLSNANLREAYLGNAHLIEVNLAGANLDGAILRWSHLSKAYMRKASLLGVDLRNANLSEAILDNSILSGTNLLGVNLSSANLTHADLSKTDLTAANLGGAKLVESNFAEAIVSNTFFGNLDLSQVKGLEEIHHYGPSTLGIDTIVKSRGKFSDLFLRGCGLSDADIESVKLYDPELSNDEKARILYKVYDLRESHALQISPLFISYSHGDGPFVDKLEIHLNDKGVRFWRDVHDAKAGRLERQIDQAIRLNPVALLILSKYSLKSDWVEHEVRTARQLEKEIGRDVLCPVALDDSWKNSQWPKRVMEQVMEYNILDFSDWKDDDKFLITFNKLIDGLGLFYK